MHDQHNFHAEIMHQTIVVASWYKLLAKHKVENLNVYKKKPNDLVKKQTKWVQPDHLVRQYWDIKSLDVHYVL